MAGPNDETAWEGPTEHTHVAQFGNPTSSGVADPNFNTAWGESAGHEAQVASRLRPVDQVLSREAAYKCPKCAFETNHKETFEAHTKPDADRRIQCERERKVFEKHEGGFDSEAFLAKLDAMLDKKIKKAVKQGLKDEIEKAQAEVRREARKGEKLARKEAEEGKTHVPGAPDLPGATGTDRP